MSLLDADFAGIGKRLLRLFDRFRVILPLAADPFKISHKYLLKVVVPATGLEPVTPRLKVLCATNCATQAKTDRSLFKK